MVIEQSLTLIISFDRFDSKTLLQKYIPEKSSDGDQVHKSANLYSGFVPWNKSKYVSIAVRFVSADKSVVKVVKIAGKPDKT